MSSYRIAVVGAGPRGVGVLERIVANYAGVAAGRPVEVHLVDPFPPGGGRVWRRDQSALLRMNSMAQDVTMFTDDAVRMDGPVGYGPSLADWAAQHGVHDAGPDGVRTPLRGTDFPTRRAQAGYLDWFQRRLLAQLPEGLTVQVRAATATDLRDGPDGRQILTLSDGSSAGLLVADSVVLAQGHLDADPDGEDAWHAAFAERHGLFHLPPAYTSDVDLSAIEPGAPVIVRGFGLAFVDLMALLTQGRGGRYEALPEGGLRYVPSGREPVLYVGSRRGVPYHAKTSYPLQGPRADLPKFFDRQSIGALLASVDGPVEFRRDVWPLIAKEVGWGYYHELLTAHPERVSVGLDDFGASYARFAWGSTEMRHLVDTTVTSPQDRLDFAWLDRPLAGIDFADEEDVQRGLRAYIAADAARRSDPAFSADLGLFNALLVVFGHLPFLMASGRIDPGSLVREFDGWFFGFFSSLASGPPGFRLEELLALSHAGVVRFVGADMWVAADATSGLFTAGSGRFEVSAAALVEARLPTASVRRTRDPLLRALYRRGEAAEEVLTGADGDRHETGRLLVAPADGRLVDQAGEPHPRRFALGSHTSVRTAAAFARPGTDSGAARGNDAVARRMLAEAALAGSTALMKSVT